MPARCLALAALLLVALSGAAAARDTTTLVISEGTQFALDVRADGKEVVLDIQGQLWLLPATGGQAQPLDLAQGDDRLPRWSPDGRSLVFQSFRSGRWGIWLKPRGEGAATPLVVDEYDNREPAWTPDGCCVVFSSDRAGRLDIWQVETASGRLHALTDDPADDYLPAVSPDGSRLAFVSDRGGRPAVYVQPRGHDGGSGFSREESTDGQFAAEAAPTTPPADSLAQPVYAAARLSAPAFSPDGQRLALSAASVELGFPSVARRELVMIDLADGTPRTLSAAHEDIFAHAPAWAADGTLWYGADGGIRRRHPDREETMPVPLAFTAAFRLKPAQPARPRPLLAPGSLQPVRGIVEPILAPDGRALVFTALGDLWQMPVDGRPTRLTRDRWVPRDPVFSADGGRLAWVSDRSGAPRIEVLEWPAPDRPDTGAPGREPQLLVDTPRGARYPAFSPDGRLLAWQQPGPRGTQDFTLQLLDGATGDVRRLAAPALWPGRMGFSADGRWLLVAALEPASARFREGRNRLLRIPVVADGPPEPVVLPDGMAIDAGPALAADGSAALLVIAGEPWLLPLAADGSSAGAPRRLARTLAEYPALARGGEQASWLEADGLRLTDTAAAGATVKALPVPLQWQPEVPAGRTVVRAGRLFDGISGDWQRDVDILIEEGRVRALVPRRAWEEGVRLIDASTLAVLPGLIDSHGHHQAQDGEWVGRAWLAFGVTAVVEPGGLPFESRALMESWDSGQRPGPRLFFAGPQLDGSRRFFPFATHIESDERLARELARAEVLGYRLLKTYTRLPNARQARVIAAARARGLPLSSHEIWPSLALGAGRVEHLRGTSRAGVSSKQGDLLRSYHDVTGLVAATGSAITPTLVVSGGFIAWLLDNPSLDEHPAWTAIYPESFRRGLRGLAGLAGRREPLLREGLANARAGVLALHQAGASVIAGTDAPIFPYGLSLVVELANYEAAGMPAAAVLMSATSAPAAALGLAGEIGTVEPGAMADLLLVDGDPLASVADLLALRGILRGGRHYPLETLLTAP